LNANFNDPLTFAWQEGYGVFSSVSQQLERAVMYVKNQKEHHKNKTAIAWLETTNHQDDPPRESQNSTRKTPKKQRCQPHSIKPARIRLN
jgi:hypothetical protein